MPAVSKKEVVENSLVILEKQVARLSKQMLERFVLQARRAVGLRGTVNVLVTSSAAVRSLNRQFRNQNKETDVLSFPSITAAAEFRKRSKVAGDVAISADIARKNSIRLGHPAVQEVKILALHGILHLAGFDHERDHGEMARKEMKLRRALGLPVGLIERVTPESVERERAPKDRRQSSNFSRAATGATGARRRT